MVRIIGVYFWEDNASFDHAYYRSRHMDITRELLVPHGLLRLDCDHFVIPGGPAPGKPVAMASAYFESLERAQAAIAAAGAQLLADVPNYTGLRPTLIFSEVANHFGESLRLIS